MLPIWAGPTVWHLIDPTSDPLVKFERKAARNHSGMRQRQARAIRFRGDIADLDSPVSGVCLAHLLRACRRDELGLRDAALLHIPSSKTDRKQVGAEAYLSFAAVAAIARWRAAGEIDKGPLLCRVTTHFDGSIDSIGTEPFPPNSITLIYKRLIRQACRQKWRER